MRYRELFTTDKVPYCPVLLFRICRLLATKLLAETVVAVIVLVKMEDAVIV